MHRIDAIGNSPGVRRELAEGIGSLLGWRKGVRQKKTKTHRKIIGSSQKTYRESLGDLSNGIGKLASNMSGDHRKKTRRLTARMSEVVGLTGMVEPPVPRKYFRRLTHTGLAGKPPVPWCSGG
ncbi:hypothetical protein BHE74_00042784 [Ensete ventricosum]|nr:hypothetical protein GW17_00036076 [Ensete ventricosum]RWW50912.1 hypothetical protein BHE74_00042784 [Ensete ventricosum]